MNDLRAWLRGLPKPELHVHLEGTINPRTYERIARRNGIAVQKDPSDAFRCRDFASFLQALLKIVQALRRPADFAELATEYLYGSAADGVRHVELFISPATQRRFVPELDLVEMVEAIYRACMEAEASTGISSLLLLDCVRNLGEEEALADVALAERCRELGVVGVGLGGDEAKFPARDFARAFARAREAGLRRTVHAGEAAGPQSMVDAIEQLHAERIGHGVAAAGFSEIIELMRERAVAIDACPASNAVTGAVPLGSPHPLREFFDAGLTVTLNSDDPGFFGTSLLDEYVAAAENLGFEVVELPAIAKMGFAASFAPEEQKLRWMAAVDEYVRVEPFAAD